jgi:predicted nucleotide-binding protein
VVATEETVTLQLSEPHFSKLARHHPDLWRRIAVEIGRRLRERNRFIDEPHNQPVLFIGSSSEGLDLATALGRFLARRPLVVRAWSDGVFQASMTSIENLVRTAREVDFAALVISPDDLTVSRGKAKPSPRDNVVFELGLLMGSIGRERVFILTPHGVDIRLPSDLLGITCVEYKRTRGMSMAVRLRQPCRTILESVRRFGPK